MAGKLSRVIMLMLIVGLHPMNAAAQSNIPKSAVVRIFAGDANRIPGTGFLVRLEKNAAYILTASHVVRGDLPPQVEFFTHREQRFAARVLDGMEDGDRGLALLVVEGRLPKGLTYLFVDTGVAPEGGEPITVIGHPASGGAWSVSAGTLSTEEDGRLYFSATIGPGNSGGPLLYGGKVMGVVTHSGSPFGEAASASAIHTFLRLHIGDKPRTVGESFRDCGDCPEMVIVSAGKFMMGSPDNDQESGATEGPQHEVTILQELAVGKMEVTRGQFARFVQETDYRIPTGCYGWNAGNLQTGLQPERSWRDPGFPQTDEHPAVCVSWHDATAYTHWLTKKTGKTYRLMSEAEWEYVARGGTISARYWGEAFDPHGCTYANIADASALKALKANWFNAQCDDRQVHTAPAGYYEANGFGLYDLIGNVGEWTQDCWNDTYNNAPQRGEARVDGDCDRHVWRGGSWRLASDRARAADRARDYRVNRIDSVGLRVARTD